MKRPIVPGTRISGRGRLRAHGLSDVLGPHTPHLLVTIDTQERTFRYNYAAGYKAQLLICNSYQHLGLLRCTKISLQRDGKSDLMCVSKVCP